MFDEILKKLNLKYEDLNLTEKETLHSWLEGIQKNQITLEKVRDYISSMRDSVELEITKTDLNTKQGIFLQARLRNYMLLEAFLQTPEKARAAIERSIASFATPTK